mmetsp:Transcript_10272/g.13355  ORF Transcript_10272/g.13355 Transcript_10272/m.13355 type:complete len:85 (-) Transcript_10272:17-271(-)
MVLGNNGFSSQSIGSNIESPLNKRLMDSSNLRTTGSCCAVCLTKPSNCVLFPCKHMRTCNSCSTRLRFCPICRTKVDEKFTVFL